MIYFIAEKISFCSNQKLNTKLNRYHDNNIIELIKCQMLRPDPYCMLSNIDFLTPGKLPYEFLKGGLREFQNKGEYEVHQYNNRNQARTIKKNQGILK